MQTSTSGESPSENGIDRRRHARYRLSAPITIRSSDGASVQGMTIEISESGTSAVTPATLNLDDTVELHPIGGGTISAQVRHRVGRVYGFQFLHLTAEQTMKIRETCKALSPFQGDRLGI